MVEWTTAITHPLGLSGFVFFLVFLLLAKNTHRQEHKRLFLLFCIIAPLTLLAGLVLAYLTGNKSRETDPRPTTIIQQKTSGDQSPAIADTKGNVTINQGKTETGSEGYPQ
jgi:hypothetical protein